MGAGQVAYAMSVVAALRDAKIVIIPYLDADKKFKNQMEFADKIRARFSMIIGEDEVKDNVVTLKDMTTGEQTKTSIADAINVLRDKR
jgi:histidyl-tRNA synthetase